MHEQDNIWRDKFNKSLADENWLEPSAALFDKIESQVFPEEKNDKIIWISLLLLVVGLAGVLVLLMAFNKSMTESTTLLNEYKTEDKIEAKIIASNEANNELKASNSEVVEVDDAIEKNEISSLEKVTEKSLLREEEKVNADQFLNFKNINEKIPLNNFTSELLRNTKQAVLTTEKSIAYLEPIKLLSRAVTPNIESSTQREEVKTSFVLNSDFVIPSKITIKRGLTIAAGLVATEFKLNNNFSSLVSPADFRHDIAKGYFVNVNIPLVSFDKWTFSAGLGYSKSEFSSGHNSNYTFDNSSGDNVADAVTLPMATPLGLLEGSVLVSSLSFVSGQDDLILDLTNSHSFATFDINLYSEYRLLQKGGFSLTPAVGFGIQKLFNLENELSLVTVSNSNYVVSDRSISADQASLNRVIPTASLGFSSLYELNDNRAIGLQFTYAQGLKPIQKLNDLSTDQSRLYMGAFYKFSF